MNIIKKQGVYCNIGINEWEHGISMVAIFNGLSSW